MVDATDVAVFVRSSDEEIKTWDRQKIVDALLRETLIDPSTALKIGKEVEEIVLRSNFQNISSSLIRELVNTKLLEYGLEKEWRRHTRLGMPIYDVEQLIFQHNKENANVPHGPEATNLTLAENIKKEFAFHNVFDKDVGDSHLRGEIHLHDVGFIDRPYCSGQSIEYIKKFGLNLPNSLSIAKPATHATVLLLHIVKFAAELQCNFAGAIGWDNITLFFAPYLVGKRYIEIKQLAQMLLFEFSQQAVARGGQAIFSDINLYWEVPDHFVHVPAIGPGGEYCKDGKGGFMTYGDFEYESQRFVMAIFEVFLEGDASGRPFFFPKPLFHITEKFFKTQGHEEFLNLICRVSTKMGNTYFVFDRGKTAKISECCRLSFKLEEDDLEDARTPWKMRYSALQNVTINLPRIAYEAEGNDAKLMSILRDRIEIAIQGHINKKDFIEKLMSMGRGGPLSLLCLNLDGETYLRLHKASYLVGMVGLNEMVQYHLGEQLHQSNNAIQFGLRVISYMNLLSAKYRDKYNMKFVLEQTPAESTAYRFAILDIKQFGEKIYHVIKGNIYNNEVYYTNSTLFNISANITPIDRVKLEGLFHPLIEAGSITHVWLGEHEPNEKSLADLIKKIFYLSKNDQVAFSPEFTICKNCNKTMKGLKDKCSYCDSDSIDYITRITGYYTKVSSWNKGKLAELKDRNKECNKI